MARHSAGKPPGSWREHGRGERGPLPTAPGRMQVLGHPDPSAPEAAGFHLDLWPQDVCLFTGRALSPERPFGPRQPGWDLGPATNLLRPRTIYVLQLLACLKDRRSGSLYSTPAQPCCLGLALDLRSALCRPGSERELSADVSARTFSNGQEDLNETRATWDGSSPMWDPPGSRIAMSRWDPGPCVPTATRPPRSSGVSAEGDAGRPVPHGPARLPAGLCTALRLLHSLTSVLGPQRV